MQCLFLVPPFRCFVCSLCFVLFWILRNVNFCVFRSFKVLVDISWKCVVKISIQHYCGTLLFEYCTNDVQSALCWVGLCKSTNCSVYVWFPLSVVLYVPCVLCFLDFEKCTFLCFSKFQSLGWHLLEMCCKNINSAILRQFIVWIL